MENKQHIEPAEGRRIRIFWAFWALIVVVSLVAFREVLVPFILAGILAYVLSPLVRRLSRFELRGKRLSKPYAVLCVYLAILFSLFATLRFSVPALVREGSVFARVELPKLRESFERDLKPRWHSLRARFGLSDRNVALGDNADEGKALTVLPNGTGGWTVELPRTGILVEPNGSHGYRITANLPSDDDEGREGGDWLKQLVSLSEGHTQDILRAGLGVVGGTIGGIFRFFITLMLSAYMVVTEDKIMGLFESLVRPDQRKAYRELLARLDRGLSGVVRGQLVICGVNGVLSAVGFALAKLAYWPLLSLVAAVFSVVPIFGSIVSSIPAVAIGLRQGFWTGLFVLGWIIGIHQLEANFLNPKIMGDAAKISPILVVFSLLVGEHFFGFKGALLAVPTMSIVQSVFLHWRKYSLPWSSKEELSTPPSGE